MGHNTLTMGHDQVESCGRVRLVLGWGARHFIGKIVQIESEFSVFPLSPLIKCISVKLLHNNKIPGTHHITPYISNIFPLT